jgi:outer membrane protein assembly factor BamB
MDRTVADRRIFIAGRKEVMAFDLSTGEVLWKSLLARGESHTMLATGKHLVVLSNYQTVPLGFAFLARTKGYIEAFSISDGTPLWGKHLGGAVASDGTASEGHISLVTAKGTLEVFRPDEY